MEQETRELLELMAAKLGTKVGELGEHLVNYTYVNGWIGMGVGTVILLISAKVAVISKGLFKKVADEGVDDDSAWATAGIAIALGLVGFLVTCIALIDVLEPTGATIKGLLK